MLINWNIVPCYFYNGNFAYTQFTEMEWIGKLSYMITDLNTKVNNVINIVDNIVNVELPEIKNRLTNIEDVELPGIKTRLTNIEDVELPGIKNRLTNIEDIEIPGMKERIGQNELNIQSNTERIEVLESSSGNIWVHVTRIKGDNLIYEDTQTEREYTIPILTGTGFNYCNISFILESNYQNTYNVNGSNTINLTFEIAENDNKIINLSTFAKDANNTIYGLLTNTITINSDISTSIKFNKDNFIDFTNNNTTTQLDFPEIKEILVTYLKN